VARRDCVGAGAFVCECIARHVFSYSRVCPARVGRARWVVSKGKLPKVNSSMQEKSSMQGNDREEDAPEAPRRTEQHIHKPRLHTAVTGAHCCKCCFATKQFRWPLLIHGGRRVLWRRPLQSAGIASAPGPTPARGAKQRPHSEHPTQEQCSTSLSLWSCCHETPILRTLRQAAVALLTNARAAARALCASA